MNLINTSISVFSYLPRKSYCSSRKRDHCSIILDIDLVFIYLLILRKIHTRYLTRFRWTSDEDLIRGPKQSFVLVHFLRWLFFSRSIIFSFPFIKHAFSYNTVFNGFFEEESNVVKLGYRLAID